MIGNIKVELSRQNDKSPSTRRTTTRKKGTHRAAAISAAANKYINLKTSPFIQYYIGKKGRCAIGYVEYVNDSPISMRL